MEAIDRLDELTRRLRRECPWDREQDERSIVPHTVEEAYELADAANSGDDAKLLDELGDVLFQVHFLSLLLDQTARNMMTAFFVQMSAINKGSSRPAAVARRTFRTLGIIGAGQMGAGIAYMAASKGLDVVLKDVDLAAADVVDPHTDARREQFADVIWQARRAKGMSRETAADLLEADGIATQVVSMPCWELFETQDAGYRARVLGQGTVRVACAERRSHPNALRLGCRPSRSSK